MFAIDVRARWHKVYKGTLLIQRFLNGEALSEVERQAVETKLDQWRIQLCDISWFMQALNEPIARQANAEDHCTGRFRESRFSSQALLDEKALAACMAYVDLDPIRATMTDKPETSDHTSFKSRISALKKNGDQAENLLPFVV